MSRFFSGFVVVKSWIRAQLAKIANGFAGFAKKAGIQSA
jgi:hypothetical protein